MCLGKKMKKIWLFKAKPRTLKAINEKKQEIKSIEINVINLAIIIYSECKKNEFFFGILFIDWGNYVYIIHMCVPTDQPWKTQINIYMRFALQCKNVLVFQRYNNVLILKFSPCFRALSICLWQLFVYILFHFNLMNWNFQIDESEFSNTNLERSCGKFSSKQNSA